MLRMKKLVIRLALFGAINAAVACVLLAVLGAPRVLDPWETDSVFEGFRLDESYDVVILGTSRAYTLSRFRDNHQALEKSLGGRVLNLAMPAGGGIKPSAAYLGEALAAGVRPKHIIVAADPFVFFAEGPNERHKFVEYEAFRFSFAARLASYGFDWRRVFSYARSKFTSAWWFRQPEPLLRHDRQAGEITEERLRGRIESLFLEGMKEATFQRYAAYLEQVVDVAQAAGARVDFVHMPTLLGHEPGYPRLREYLDDLVQRHADTCTYHDWTDAMRDPAYFYDLDHLNAAGAAHFATEILTPALRAAI